LVFLKNKINARFRKKKKMFLVELPEEKAEKLIIDIASDCSEAACQQLFWQLIKANAGEKLVKPLVTFVDTACDNNRALRQCCKLGNVGVCRLLLGDERVDPGANENEALGEACSAGHGEIVDMLLGKKEVDPTVQNHFLLVVAAFKGYLDIVKLLMKDGRCDPSVREALHQACTNNHFSTVEALLEDERVQPVTPLYNCFQQSVANDEQKPGLLALLAGKRPEAWENQDKRQLLKETIHFAHLDDVKFMLEFIQGDDLQDFLVLAIHNTRPSTVAHLLQLVNPALCAEKIVGWEGLAAEPCDENAVAVARLLMEDKRLAITKDQVKEEIDDGDLDKAHHSLKRLKRRRALEEDLSQKRLKIEQ
jgi:hypothetical protein